MRRSARVLVVGVGGLGCPVALVLARAGVGTLRLCDDDVVDESNLHRQILFDASSIGKPKLDEAKRVLEHEGARIEVTRTRFLPEVARELLEGCDVVVEGADNFPTKFLVADACARAKIPVVHAAAVAMHGTALAVGARGAPCYRCVFEDVPPAEAATCAEAGVLGPMVGVVAALQADLALGFLDGKDVAGTFVSYDAERDFLRRTRIAARPSCVLCGGGARRYISDMETTVRIPAPLRTLTGGKDEVTAGGATVGELIDELDKKHPGIKERLLDEKGVRRFVNIYVGEEDVRFLEGLKTALQAGDKVSIVPAIAGG